MNKKSNIQLSSDSWWRKRFLRGRGLSRFFLCYHFLPVLTGFVAICLKLILLFVFDIIHFTQDSNTKIIPKFIILILVSIFVWRINNIFFRLLFDLLASPPNTHPLLRELFKAVTRTTIQPEKPSLIRRHSTPITPKSNMILNVNTHLSLSSKESNPILPNIPFPSLIQNDSTSKTDSNISELLPPHQSKNSLVPCCPFEETKKNEDNNECQNWTIGTSQPTKVLFMIVVCVLIILFVYMIQDFFSLECSRSPNWIWSPQNWIYCTSQRSDCVFWCDAEFKLIFVTILIVIHLLITIISIHIRKTDFDTILTLEGSDINVKTSMWVAVLLHDRLWEEVNSDIRYISTLISIINLPLFWFFGDIPHAFSSFLILCSGQALFYAILWFLLQLLVFGVQFHNTIQSFFVTYPSSSIYLDILILFFGISISIFLASHNLTMCIIVFLSLSRIRGMKKVNPDYVVISSKLMAKKFIKWFSYFFAFLIIVVLFGTLQTLFFRELGEKPHFFLRHYESQSYLSSSSIYSISVFAGKYCVGVMNISIYDSTPLLSSPSNQINLSHNYQYQPHYHQKRDDYSYNYCENRFEGLSYVDLAFASQLIYFPSNSSEQHTIIKTFFPDFHLEYWHLLPHSNVRFIDLYSPSRNLSIISIRGTNLYSLADYLECLDLLSEGSTFKVFGIFLPGLSLWPSNLIAHLILPSSESRHRYYYEDVEMYLKTIQKNRKVILTGHSLGGTIAQIVGSRSQNLAVSFGGPGLMESRLKFDISLENLQKYIINIINQYDLIPSFGSFSGNVIYLSCPPASPEVCHNPIFTISQLFKHCGYNMLNTSVSVDWPTLRDS